MDLAKDILDVAEKVGQAPGLTIASSIVTSILKTVETSKNNTVRLRALAHSLANQLVEISENMEGKWDDAPLTLKRAVDEYDAFLLEMFKGITRLSQYSPVRAFILAGECEREITRLEKRVVDARSTVMLMIVMNLSVEMNRVREEVHSCVQRLRDGARVLVLEPDIHQMTPDLSLFTREDFQVMKTIFRKATYDWQCRDAMTVTFNWAERCSNGLAIVVKTFEGNDPGRVRRQCTEELKMSRKTLNPAVLQIIGRSNSTEQIPFHVYHAPCGIIEPFYSWAERTIRSNPVETIFGLNDMVGLEIRCYRDFSNVGGQFSSDILSRLVLLVSNLTVLDILSQELVEFNRSHHVGYWNVLRDGVVNIQHRGDRPRFALIYAGRISELVPWFEESSRPDYYDYGFLNTPGRIDCYEFISDKLPAAKLASMFAAGAKYWFEDPHGFEALFKGSYDTIDPLQLGPVLLDAGWLSRSFMDVTPRGSMKLGDVGFLAQDGHFEVITNLHAKLVSRTGGLPGWTYTRSPFNKPRPEDEYAVVTHAEKLYRRYKHVITPREYKFSRTHWDHEHYARYTDLDEGHAWKTLQQEAFRIIEDNRLLIAPHDLQLITLIKDMSVVWIGRRRDWIGIVELIAREDFPPDPDTVTVYEYQQGGLQSVIDSGVPELNPEVFYSFRETIDGRDPIEMQEHPETGDILMVQDPTADICYGIGYLQLPLGVTRPSGIEEIPD